MSALGDSPIVERSPDGKLGYYQGFRAGFEWALVGFRRGLSPDEIQAACEQVSATMAEQLPTEER